MSPADKTSVSPIALVIAFVLLGVAWAGGNPPAASPDENAHFIKAYASADGQIRGEPLPASDDPAVDPTSIDGRRARWFRVSNRTFRLPARLLPPPAVTCYAFDRERTADCQDFRSPFEGSDATAVVSSHLGTYSPFPYLISGTIMRGAGDFRSAAWRGRLASLALCILFVGWASALLRRGGMFSLVGLVCAITPMVVFLAGSLNTSGIEITAAILLWSSAITLVREPVGRQSSAWPAFAIAGMTLALTRPLGAIMLTVIAATIFAFAGLTRMLAAIRQTPRSALAAITLVSLACGFSFLWAHFAIPHPSVDYGIALASLGKAIRDLPNQVREIIGIFGWNETTMPLPAYLLGLFMLAGLGALALAVGSARERLVLTGLAVCIVTLDLMLAVLVEAQIGFGMQVRYLLPLIVGLSLISGDIVQRQVHRLPHAIAYRAAAAAFAGSALLHAMAFLSNEHRYAVGTSGVWLPPWDLKWSPEGGLAIWVMMAATGCCALAAAAVTLYRRAQLQPLASSAQRSHDPSQVLGH